MLILWWLAEPLIYSWCSTGARLVNMKGKENTWLFFQGTGLLATAPGAAGGRSRLPAWRCQREQLPAPAWAPNGLHAHFSKYLALLGRLGKNNFWSLSPSVADFYLIWRPGTAVTKEPQGEMARMHPVQWASLRKSCFFHRRPAGLHWLWRCYLTSPSSKGAFCALLTSLLNVFTFPGLTSQFLIANNFLSF